MLYTYIARQTPKRTQTIFSDQFFTNHTPNLMPDDEFGFLSKYERLCKKKGLFVAALCYTVEDQIKSNILLQWNLSITTT